MRKLVIPIPDDQILELNVGDPVLLQGVMLTGRDTVHKWMIETFVEKSRKPAGDDLPVYEAIRRLLAGGALYHCGPVVTSLNSGEYQFVAAGPTTSIREEPYQADVMRHFNLKAVIGKGGMAAKTLAACQEVPAVYLHAIGGAATLIAETVRKVRGVYKLDFGVPEAMWEIEVVDFPAVVTMDAHGHSLHDEIEARSRAALQALLA